MNEILLKDDTSSEISFALPKEVLANVLFEFLGKKEKLSYQKVCNYCLELNDIKQFYHLLRNKIDKEKTTEVDFFQATIFYNDDTNRTFNSYAQIEEFHEVKSVIPLFFIMNWHIIVDFPNSQTIETQKIELVYGVNDDEDGFVTCIIDHTNYIWATEVLNLFSSQISKTLTPNNKKVELLAKFTPMYKFGMIIITFLALIVITSVAKVTPDRPNYYEELVKRNITIFGKGELKEVLLLSNISENKKILGINIINSYDDNTLLKLMKTNIQDKIILTQVKRYIENSKEISKVITELDEKDMTHPSFRYRFFPWVVIVIVCLWAFYLVLFLFNKQYQRFYRTEPFILVTDLAKQRYNDFLESKNKAVLYGGGATLFAIISSLAATFIWWLLSNSI